MENSIFVPTVSCHVRWCHFQYLWTNYCWRRNILAAQLNFINTDSDNTDSRFTRTNFFGPARSPWFYIQPLMDNTDSANADFRLTQTRFRPAVTKIPQLTRTAWLSGLRSYTTARRLSVVYSRIVLQLHWPLQRDIQPAKWDVGWLHCLLPVHANPMREVDVAVGCWLFSLSIVGLRTCTSCIHV